MPIWPGQDRDDAAGHAALRRQAHAVGPLPREVVHATRVHHAQCALDALLVERPPAGDRVHATVRERRRHHREVTAVDEQRALAEVEVDGLVDVTVDHAEALHEVRERAVAVAGHAFRREHRVVDREPSPREAGETVEEALGPRVRVDAVDEGRS